MPVDLKATGPSAPVSLPAYTLPDGVPQFSLAEVDAACKRSVHAKRFRRDFQSAVDDGRVFSRFEIREMLERAKTPDGKNDGHAGVVAAYYAENQSQIFDADARKEVTKFLKGCDWNELMRDLKEFMQKLKDEAAQAEKERQIRHSLELDEIKRDDIKLSMKKDNGTRADRAKERVLTETKKSVEKEKIHGASDSFIEEELTGSGRLPLSEAELTKLALHKKAFSNS